MNIFKFKPMQAAHKLNVVIVDDESSAIEGLSLLIKQYCPALEIVGSTVLPNRASAIIEKQLPDIVFLDINMPRLGGFDLLKLFKKREFYVVIITASEKHAIEAINADVAGYLLKPFVVDDLVAVVDKIQQKIAAQIANTTGALRKRKVSLPVVEGFRVLEVEKVIMLQAYGLYTTVYYEGEAPIKSFVMLKHFESFFLGTQIVRTHKSFLVNLDRVIAFIPIINTLTLAEGHTALVSRRKRVELGEMLNKIGAQ